jgi:hypothetical protein
MYPLLSNWILPENKRENDILRHYIKDPEMTTVKFVGLHSSRHIKKTQLL